MTELTLSPSFVAFLEYAVRGSTRLDEHPDWATDGAPRAAAADLETANRQVRETLRECAATPQGRLLIDAAAATFEQLLHGGGDIVAQFQQTFHVWAVVAAPRHGSSYLAKSLIDGFGYARDDFPAWFVHDGTPDMRPEYFSGGRSWTHYAVMQTAEWMTMARWFAARLPARATPIALPKKFMKAVYAGPFVHDVLGPATTWVIGLRHPAAAAASLYAQAGGLPADARFPLEARSIIELWVQRALRQLGYADAEIAALPYFSAFLLYWEDWHQKLAVSGLVNRASDLRVLAYGRSAYEGFAAALPGAPRAEPLRLHRHAAARHPDWIAQALPVLERLATLWQQRGLPFPLEALLQAW
jgi:hypothetical protein